MNPMIEKALLSLSQQIQALTDQVNELRSRITRLEESSGSDFNKGIQDGSKIQQIQGQVT